MGSLKYRLETLTHSKEFELGLAGTRGRTCSSRTKLCSVHVIYKPLQTERPSQWIMD